MSELDQPKCEIEIKDCAYAASVLGMYSVQGSANPEAGVAPIIQTCKETQESEIFDNPEAKQILEEENGCYYTAQRRIAKLS